MSQINAGLIGPFANAVAQRCRINLNCVEPRTREHLVAEIEENGSQSFGFTMDLGRDRAGALRAMVHCERRSDYGQQHLGGADVARGLVPPDMLLASLQG